MYSVVHVCQNYVGFYSVAVDYLCNLLRREGISPDNFSSFDFSLPRDFFLEFYCPLRSKRTLSRWLSRICSSYLPALYPGLCFSSRLITVHPSSPASYLVILSVSQID